MMTFPDICFALLTTASATKDKQDNKLQNYSTPEQQWHRQCQSL